MRFQAWRLLPAKSALSQSAVANLSLFPSGGRVGLPLEVLVANQVVGLHSELYAEHGTKEVRHGYLYGRMEDGARSCTGGGGGEGEGKTSKNKLSTERATTARTPTGTSPLDNPWAPLHQLFHSA